jgi:phage tail sheath protein FI
VVPNGAATTNGAAGNLNLSAVGPGAWGNNIMVKVDPATQADPASGRDWFRMSILYYRNPPVNFVDPTSTAPADLANPDRREPDVLEIYDNLTHTPGAGNNVVTVINASSRLVTVAWSNAGPARVPDQAFTALGANGDDGPGNANITAAEFIGDLNDPVDQRSGLAALETIDDISLLVVPDEVRRNPQDLSPVTDEMINQCERLKDRFAVLSVIQGQSDVSAIPARRDSSYAAIYYPWIQVYDPAANTNRLVPPAGYITGIFARTDIERGVHKAPANEVVRDAREMEFPVTKGMQDVLNPNGVNCIRDFRPDGRSIRVWGARTTSSDPEWRYVNVRRLFLFVEESIDEGTQWVVFEPNDENLWSRVSRSISNFLIGVWRSGALMGLTQEEAFFVKCDRTTMTQDDIDNGRLICYIGIAPVKPAEFVIFRISQKTAEA